jgi:hypothetical protein
MASDSDLIVKPRKWTYGIRSPKKMEIWPLSIGDQDALGRRLDDTFKDFSRREASDIDFAVFVMQMLRDNIGEIMRLVTGLDENGVRGLLADVTNKQAWALVEMVWEENYADLLKNLSGLLGKIPVGVVDAVAAD